MALVAMHQCCARAYVRQGARRSCLRNSAPRLSNGIMRVCLSPPRCSRLVKATATGEQIDPATGEVVRPNDPRSYKTGFSVEAGGLTWAYRDNGVESTETPALLIHGLGSCSYCWRQSMCLLATNGVRAVAPDWIGHGDSDKPGPGTFGYDKEAYMAGLDAFVAALGLERMQLVVQGFVLPQYALLWALRNPEKVERLVILNTPLSAKSQLRPELAAYKNPIPFLRPSADKPFAADLYAASGLSYAMMYNDSLVYLRAYGEGEGGTAALAATMDRLDWPALLRQVDEEMQGWRNESVIFFGAKDPFCDISEAILFLETKRTNIKLVSIEAKMGHMPQEDYPEALNDMLTKFMAGVDVSVKGVLRPGVGKNLTDD